MLFSSRTQVPRSYLLESWICSLRLSSSFLGPTHLGRDHVFWDLGSGICSLRLSSSILECYLLGSAHAPCLCIPSGRVFVPPQVSILPYLEVIFVVVSASICCLLCVTFWAGVCHSVTLVTSFCVAVVPFNVEVDRSPTPSRSVVSNLILLSVIGHLFFFLSHRRRQIVWVIFRPHCPLSNQLESTGRIDGT